MDCEVAREALSARLDGEREPVPSARVDEHLAGCAACRTWFDQVAEQAQALRRLVESRPVIAPVGPSRIGSPPSTPRSRLSWQRWALFVVGLTQLVLAGAQAFGLSMGLQHHPGNHLLNESTSWSVAVALAMMVAALWTRAAAGLASVLAAFVGVLTVYVVADAIADNVTWVRILSHLPVVIGAVLAVVVWRSADGPEPIPADVAADPDIVLPQNASRGRRRGHLWPTDGSAA
ncbi:hypothetical protein A5634_07840 [Mycobacterium asiaticum]|uniref:Putative zinc-finger domain-containing protein n=1 Tax=Mycobacterium asiaticum TaxID=1790 RepID=A0A1A3NIU2_MYCAS|nr:zf-HC2 domain-containing protein [Mycobacterium asiaticum]OBK22078.1 hypothetical protein A5634_07840 [Mycobacterium asiaticum]